MRTDVPGEPVDGALAIDRQGRPAVAFSGPDGLVLATRTGSSWQTETVDPEGEGTPAVATDEAGKILIAYSTPRGIRAAWQPQSGSGSWTIAESFLPRGVPLLAASSAGIFYGAVADGELSVTRHLLRRAATVRAPVSPAAPEGVALAVGPVGVFATYQDAETADLVVLRDRDPGDASISLVRILLSSAPGSLLDQAADAEGSLRREVFLYNEPIRREVVLATRAASREGGNYVLGPGAKPALAIDRAGSAGFVAFWDPVSHRLLGADVDLRSERPDAGFGERHDVSGKPAPLPAEDLIAIALAALAMVVTVAAGATLLAGRAALVPYAFAAVVLLSIAARGIYVGFTGIFGLYPHDRFFLDGPAVQEVVQALALMSLAAAVMIVAALLSGGLRGRFELPRLRALTPPSQRAAVITLALFSAITVVALGFVLASRGLGNLFSDRQSLFGDRGYLQLAIVGAGGAFLVYLSSVRELGKRRQWMLTLLVGLVVGALILLTGSRSAALTGLILPALLYVHLRLRPISWRGLVLIGSVLVIAGVGLRLGVREQLQDVPAASSTTEPPFVQEVLDPFLGGSELGALDGFVLVRSEYVPRFGTDFGETVAAIATAPVPRAIWADKPSGAMARFTAGLDPERFDLTGSELTTSLAGDLYMSGRTAMLLVGFAVLGLALVLLGHLARGASGFLGVLVAVIVIPRLASALWGDLFNASVGVAQVLIPTLAALALAHGIDRFVFGRRSGESSDELAGTSTAR